jgi:hypothetical protein
MPTLIQQQNKVNKASISPINELNDPRFYYVVLMHAHQRVANTHVKTLAMHLMIFSSISEPGSNSIHGKCIFLDTRLQYHRH